MKLFIPEAKNERAIEGNMLVQFNVYVPNSIPVLHYLLVYLGFSLMHMVHVNALA